MNKISIFLKLFYSPPAAMRDARDRVSIFGAALVALVAHAVYLLYAEAPYLGGALASRRIVFSLFGVTLGAAHTLLFIGLVFVPVLIFVANMFERRGGIRVVIGQEYASLASTTFFAYAAANVAALLSLAGLRATGAERLWIEQNLAQHAELQQRMPQMAEFIAAQSTPQNVSQSIASMILLVFFAIWATVAVREVFRSSPLRTISIVAAGGLLMLPLTVILYPLFVFIVGSPLLLIVLFIFGRAYVAELTRTQQARASFRQNLEAATLNPADASAHYQLGLIHLDRKELIEARERFARAVEIDPEEADAHYQLGRISRRENKYAEAIEHFGQTVTRDPAHAQHEVWREIGATYLAAGQAEDARDALERFLDARASDPEGLYLMGRALSELNRPREAKELMQRCIDAVRSAPAYKYRTEKRWMTEAESFLRSQA